MKNTSERKVLHIDRVNPSPLWNYKQEDDGTLLLNLYKGGQILDCTGQTITLGVKNSKGQLIEHTEGITINKSNVDIVLKNSIFAVKGKLECDLILKDNTGQMSTATFYLMVGGKVLGSDNILSQNEVVVLDKVNNWLEESKDLLDYVNQNMTEIEGVKLLKGDKGEKGDRGEQGVQGIQGTRGEKGEAGLGATQLEATKQDKVDNTLVTKEKSIPKAINELSASLDNKTDKTITDNIQGQVNNLVLGAVGDGNNAEVVQARGKHTLLNDRLNYFDYSLDNFKDTNDIATLTNINNANGIIRHYVPFKIIANNDYELQVIFNKYTLNAQSTVAFSIKTTLDKTTTTIKDTIVSINKADFTGGDLNLKFKSTANADFLYIYLNVSTTDNQYNILLKQDSFISLASKDKVGFVKVGNGLGIEDDGTLNVLHDENIKQHKYTGEKIELNKKTFDCNLYLTLNTNGIYEAPQGCAIHEGKLFQLYHLGNCNVYDLEGKNSVPLQTFRLGSYGTDNHANSCNFSDIYFNGNTNYPLLYVTDGNSAEVMKCSVENIKLENGVYSSEKIQDINLNQSGFEAKGYMPYWGWSTWYVDSENNWLYYFGARYRTNGSMNDYYDNNRYIITKFKLPSLDNANVILTADDVIEQFVTEYDINVTQGGTLHNNHIYHTYGFGNATYPSAIRVFDLKTKCLSSKIDLSFIIEELESCSIYNGKLYVSTVNSKLYELEF